MREYPQYALTVPDILDLRMKMKRNFISDGTNVGYPFITYGLAGKEYYLHSEGFTVAISANNDVIAACLRNERLEPGYCRRILSALEAPDIALLIPEARHDETARRNEHAARIRFNQQEAADLARERSRMSRETPADHKRLTLDDLL